jgi:hypothetical protein
MQNRVLKLLLLFFLWPQCAVTHAVDPAVWQSTLTRYIPTRPHSAMSGSEFGRYIAGMRGEPREQAILLQLLQGNLPAFQRGLKPVLMKHLSEDGKEITATIFVMPDYLAIGSNRDFLRVPMDLHTASEVASRFGFVLPTKRMVDAIYEQSVCRFRPEPMTPGPRMCSTAYYVTHNRKIKEQRMTLGTRPGELASGHKKDVVLTNRLSRDRGKIAIYGWHRPTGIPIQPLSTVHGASYADYSHGIRLVSDIVLIDDQPRSIYEVLKDPVLSKVLSEEGTIPNAPKIIKARRTWEWPRLDLLAKN